MPNKAFDVPVAVDNNQAGNPRIVADTLDAAEILLRRWPHERRGQNYVEAVRACLDAMEGRRDGCHARRAFVRAAKSASIFVGTNIRRIF
jgi:hypothetical protein